jgi:hypothetical protein
VLPAGAERDEAAIRVRFGVFGGDDRAGPLRLHCPGASMRLVRPWISGLVLLLLALAASIPCIASDDAEQQQLAPSDPSEELYQQALKIRSVHPPPGSRSRPRRWHSPLGGPA